MGSKGDRLPNAFGTTRRPEERGGLFPKARLRWVRARSTFRPAGRRAVQASGLCYPKTNFRTRSWLPCHLIPLFLPPPDRTKVRSIQPVRRRKDDSNNSGVPRMINRHGSIYLFHRHAIHARAAEESRQITQ